MQLCRLLPVKVVAPQRLTNLSWNSCHGLNVGQETTLSCAGCLLVKCATTACFWGGRTSITVNQMPWKTKSTDCDNSPQLPLYSITGEATHKSSIVWSQLNSLCNSLSNPMSCISVPIIEMGIGYKWITRPVAMLVRDDGKWYTVYLEGIKLGWLRRCDMASWLWPVEQETSHMADL